MRRFTWEKQREAIRWAAAGGQALHVHSFGVTESSPAVFRSAVERRGESPVMAHLFDWNQERLTTTARALGVVRLHVDRPGSASMHVDLVGRPLEKAVSLSVGAVPDTIGDSLLWRVASAHLWMRLKGLRPVAVYRGSVAEGWKWSRPWPAPSRSNVRGTAFFHASWGAAPDGSAIMDNAVWRWLSATRDQAKTTTMVNEGFVQGFMYQNRVAAIDAIEVVFKAATAREVAKLLGWWSELDTRPIDDPSEYVSRHRFRFGSAPEERELRLAFGRAAI